MTKIRFGYDTEHYGVKVHAVYIDDSFAGHIEKSRSRPGKGPVWLYHPWDVKDTRLVGLASPLWAKSLGDTQLHLRKQVEDHWFMRSRNALNRLESEVIRQYEERLKNEKGEI